MFISEISASLYPWDLADEGIERILDNLQAMTSCNSVYLIALMHQEKRPLTDLFYPHNPVRKTYAPEDSRVFFWTDPSFYGRIQPRPSERDFLKDTDWLRVLIDAARQRGMRTGVELSHTLIDAERGRGELADCMQRDIFGNHVTFQIGRPAICFNQPDVLAYACGLFADLATHYDVDYIQTCVMPFDAGPHHAHPALRTLNTTLGGCFCDACRDAAREQGIDLERIRAALLPIAVSLAHPAIRPDHDHALLTASNTTATAVLMETPELFQWLLFRRDSLVRFFKAIHERVHAIKPPIDLRLNAYITAQQELSGLDLRALSPYLDSIRSSDYSEQSGDANRLEHKRQWLLSVRRAVGEEKRFLSAIGVRPKATPELIRQGVVVSAQCGVDGITIGHYDGATFGNLRAVKEGLQWADVEMLDERPAQPGASSARR